MEYKKLGKSNLEVSAIALGSGFGKKGITEDTINVIRRAIDLGINMIDTAEVYRKGMSEKVVGEAIKGRRDDIIIVSKVWRDNLKYNDVLKAAEGSLKRLGVRTIDLYLIHRPSSTIPIGETIRAMERLVDDGRVRYMGVSNFEVFQLKEAREALSKYEIIANEVEYNLVWRHIEAEILPYCMKENIGILAYSPLARGLLTGKPKPWRTADDMFHEDNLSKAQVIFQALEKIGAVHGKTATQVALNWVASKPGIIALFGASSTDQIEENCGALGWRMSREDIEVLDVAREKSGILYKESV